MAFLTRLSVTRWIDPTTGQRVSAGTMGATKVRERVETYTIVDKDGGRITRTNTGMTDKRAAVSVLNEYHRRKERGETGLTDPYAVHLDRPTLDHLGEYVVHLRRDSRSNYPDVVSRELTRLFSAVKAVRLRDLNPDRVQTHLDQSDVSPTTRNKWRTYLFSFFGWLIVKDRHPSPNPITKVHRASELKASETKRRRRAISPADLRRLLQAVRSYPLSAASVNRGGRPRADGTRPAPSVAKLTPVRVAHLTQLGQERTLFYRVALLTGLRRGELSRVLTRHVRLSRGVIDLPAASTKNGKRAIVPVPPALLADIGQWITDTGKGPTDRLFFVPDGPTLSQLHIRHLRHANVPYSDTEGRFCDFHSLRKTLNTYLRKHGVSLRLRQRVLRHTAGDLATSTYDHETLNELKPIVRLLDRLDRFLTRPDPDLAPKSGTV